MKGTYILLINLKENKTIKIGKLGNKYFKKGYYAYLGSALNGLEQRIFRHKRKEKKFHWHIDYLLKHAEIKEIFYKKNSNKEECSLSKKLEKNFDYIIGFGCSDCKCKSHLYYGEYENLRKKVEELLPFCFNKCNKNNC